MEFADFWEFMPRFMELVGKVFLTFVVFVFGLMSAVWPIGDRPTTKTHKFFHGVVMTIIWYFIWRE